MSISLDEFKKLRKHKHYSMNCLCGNSMEVSPRSGFARCEICKRRWIVEKTRAALMSLVKMKKCKYLPSYSTNKYGQCKRKVSCEAMGRKCNAVEKIYVPVVKL